MSSASIGTRPLPQARSRPQFGAGVLGRIRWLAGEAASFEGALVLFLASNALEVAFNLPFNLTLPSLGLSMLAGGLLIVRRGLPVHHLPVALCMLLFVLWAVVTLAWTPSRIVAPDKTRDLIIYNLWLVVAMGLIIAPSRERLTRFFALLLIVGALVSAFGIMVVKTYGSARAFSEEGRAHLVWGRVVGPMVVVACLGALYARFFSLKQIVMTGLTLLGLLYLLLGGGRGPMIAAAIACVVPLMLGIPFLRRRLVLPRSQALLLVAGLLAAAGLALFLMSGNTTPTIKKLLTFLASDNTIQMGTSREKKLDEAYELWIDAPVLGKGFGGYVMAAHGREIVGRSDYPHNIVMEILCELGLVGLAFFLLFLWSAVHGVRLRRLRQEPLLLCSLMLFVNALINAMVTADLPGNAMVFGTAALLGMRPPAEPAGDEEALSRRR